MRVIKMKYTFAPLGTSPAAALMTSWEEPARESAARFYLHRELCGKSSICHDSCFKSSQPTHNRKKNLPSRPSTAVLQRARLITHEFEEYFEQVRLHDIKDSTFAINRTRPNDEKTEILLGCVQYVFVIEPLLNMYFFPVTMRPWTALSWCPPALRSNRSCLGTSKTVRKLNSDQFVKKKLIIKYGLWWIMQSMYRKENMLE